MKNKRNLFSRLFLLHAFLWSFFSSAHEVVVHKQITLNAASLVTNNVGYSAILDTITFQNPYGLLPIGGDYRPPIGWIAEGSVREDDATDEGGYRSFNHFYNPLNGQGLSDIPPLKGDGDYLYGRPSFIWAALFNEAGLDVDRPIANKNTQNIWSWQNVRQYELQGLTNSNLSTRAENMGKMYRGLGDVVHLLQDASQPQHVRNEQHLDKILIFPSPYHSAIEKYGADHWQTLNYSSAMLDWRGAGFTKMQDFWDRGFYAANGVQALKDDANGVTGKKLGLAEFSNGNFIGKTTTYPEYFKTSDKDYSKHYFQHPSLFSSTDYSAVKTTIAGNVRTVLLKNGASANRIYLDKIGDGIVFSNCSVLTYLGWKYAHSPTPYLFNVSSTIDDDNVLQAYHDQLVPKAVEYSAGLLDYYFRGTMDVSAVGFDTNSMLYTNLIVNTSGQDFSGGTFSIYQDDASGVRTLMAQTNFSGHTLPNSGSMTMMFPDPQNTNAIQCIVVYQGTIGLTSGSPSDSIDAGIGIAAKGFILTPLCWIWQDIWPGGSSGSFSFTTNVFSVAGSSPPIDKIGRYVGRIPYSGSGSQLTITLNGTVLTTWYGSAGFDLIVGYAGETPLYDTPFGAPSTFSNYAINVTIPDTGGFTKMLEVTIFWDASKVEGYSGDSGSVDVSGILTNPKGNVFQKSCRP